MKQAATLRRGRPPRHQSGKIEEDILEAAAALFLTEGYGATSIEAVARRIGISKRTFYARFNGKPALFMAVVQRLINRLRPPPDMDIFHGGSLEDVLLRLANLLLQASLTPQSLALQRVMVAEVTRFPELAVVFASVGARQEAIDGIAGLLKESHPQLDGEQALFAATQFLHLVVAEPQRRALGLGTAFTQQELEQWGRRCVALFLKGLT